jgi:HlyD family secretion protein
MKKKLSVISGVVVIIMVGLVIFRSISRNKNTKEQPFRTVLVERGNILVKVTESGKVEPVTTVDIKSELAGEVKKLFVEEGDSVKVGDELALVQQESSQAQKVAQARASLERAKLDLEDVKRNLERTQELYQKGFIAKKDVEDAEKSYESSKIQYELAEKQLWLVLGGTETIKPQSLASKTFDNIIVKSPISGIVINLNVEEGEMITSGTQAYGGGGTALMTIADLSKMIVKTNINEVDVGKVRVGQQVNIGFDAIRDKIYQGVVKKIAPAGTIEGNIVVYPVEVEILGSVHVPEEKRRAGIELIKPGMTADLDIIVSEAEGVLCVPKEAVIERAGRTLVMSIKDEKAVPQQVVTGLEDDVKVEIKEGLKEGDEVVITGFERIPEKLGRSMIKVRRGPM